MIYINFIFLGFLKSLLYHFLSCHHHSTSLLNIEPGALMNLKLLFIKLLPICLMFSTTEQRERREKVGWSPSLLHLPHDPRPLVAEDLFEMPPTESSNSYVFFILEQGSQTHFQWGPYQPQGCLQRAKCNFKTV